MAVIFYGTTVAALALDLWSKWHVFRAMKMGQSYSFIPRLLSFRLSMNEGAAFGMGKGWGAFFVVVSLAASAAMVWGAHKYGRHSKFLLVGLALLLSGALGNIYDRIFHAWKVRDFLDLHLGAWHYPAIFNVADAAICIGCGIIILYSFRTPQKKQGSVRG